MPRSPASRHLRFSYCCRVQMCRYEAPGPRHGGSPQRRLKPGTVLLRDYQGQRHTVTVARDGFDWQGTTYASLSAIARTITGTAWSGPRFFALAPRNGTSARGNNKRSARGDRNGSQPARGSNKASLPLETVSPA